MREEQSIEKLKQWLSPVIPIALIFGKRAEALDILEQIGRKMDGLADLNHTLREKLDSADKESQNLQTRLADLTDENENLEGRLRRSEQEAEQKEAELDSLNGKVAEQQLRQTLIAKLLSASNPNQGMLDYYHLLNHDFLEFANQEDSLEEEAAAFLELQAIGDELKVVASYPEFYKKRSLAIAGGFSAGKSEFISSLFEDPSVRLPIGIEPTTAIPTYALNGKENGVIGCSQNGGAVDLLEIDPDFQHKLSHNFIRSFGFNLKNIMPFVFMTTPMKYGHLCFIDTPGYNPSDVEGGHTSEDIKTAEEFVQNAEALLWLIGLDANGTISKSDLEFLTHIDRNNQEAKPLYIVLNKADLRPFDQLEDIMQEIVETLDDYDIEVAGISAYSSKKKKEFLFHNQPLHEFLAELDRPSEKQSLILQRLYAVDAKYQCAILRTVKENRQVSKTLSGLKLDLLENGFDDIDSDLYGKINKMKALFDSMGRKQTEHLKRLERVMTKMAESVNRVFGQPGKVKRKTWMPEDIELDDKYARLNQKDELPEELEDDVSERRRQIDELVSQSDVMKKVYDNARKKGHKKRR